MRFTSKSLLKEIYRKRPLESHKGDFGRLLVIGGSNLYTGSPALAALAALRSGADLAYITAPDRAADTAAGFSPDVIAYPLRGGHLEEKHLKDINGFIRRCDAVAIGNGLGRNPKTKRAVLRVLKDLKKPCVIDADAIHFVAERRTPLKKNFILTPHGAEFQKLTGFEVTGKKIKEKIKAVESAAGKLNCTVLLKGGVDVVSDGKRTALNRAGTPCMTAGGTGDVLAGICGSLLARGVRPFEAACAAAWMNGMAGKLAAKKFGEGLTGSDLIGEIPNVIKG